MKKKVSDDCRKAMNVGWASNWILFTDKEF